MSGTAELSRMIDVRFLPEAPTEVVASEAECAALAARFDLVAVKTLKAAVTFDKAGAAVLAKGTLEADIVQSCAVSGEDLPVRVREKLALRFVPVAEHSPDEEVELDANALDEIEYDGTAFDLGEEIAQSLALAIDPFAEGPGANQARRKAGIISEEASGPFSALAALKKPD